KVTFQPGQDTAEIHIPILNDGVHERPETFKVLLSGPQNAVTLAGSGTTTVTINDDEAVPELVVSDFTVLEGNSNSQTIEITVNLKDGRPADRDISFDWAAIAGSASPGSDFTTSTTTATIAANATQAKL